MNIDSLCKVQITFKTILTLSSSCVLLLPVSKTLLPLLRQLYGGSLVL